jgi:tetratricopeptide (TPR) repeat protein
MRTKIIIVAIILIIISMGLFSFFGKNDRYVSESAYKRSVTEQEGMNGQTLTQLSKQGVNGDSQLSLEFFFYTDNQDKASNLAIELNKLNYNIESVGKFAGDSNLWKVSGWTTPIKMDISSVTAWTEQMCKLGFENDCDFDGWGTNPDQEEVEVEKGLTAVEYYNKGTELFDKGQVRAAEAYYSKSIELEKKVPVAYYGRAYIRASSGRKIEAIEDYTSALIINPRFYEAYENRGAIKDEMGDYDGAIEDYTKSIEINSQSSIAYLNRGNSKYRKGDKDGACMDWTKAKELGDKTAEENLANYCK